MYTIHEISLDRIYLAFPRDNNGDNIPDPEVYDWIIKNIDEPNWGIVNNQTCGVFLSHEDASAFRLAFG